jgi:hypothetical protein
MCKKVKNPINWGDWDWNDDKLVSDLKKFGKIKNKFKINILGVNCRVYFRSFGNTITKCTLIVDTLNPMEDSYFSNNRLPKVNKVFHAKCTVKEGDAFSPDFGEIFALQMAIEKFAEHYNGILNNYADKVERFNKDLNEVLIKTLTNIQAKR